MEILLLARDEHSSNTYFDPRAAKVVERTSNPLEEVRKLGIECHPVPENLVVFHRKNTDGEPIPVCLDEMKGDIFMLRIENGQVVDNFRGRHLDRVQILTLKQVQLLQQRFAGTKNKRN